MFTSRTTARAVTSVVAALILALTAGCREPQPPEPPEPTSPLLEWKETGGLCLPGMCGRTLLVERSGTWRGTAGSEQRSGTLEPAALATLTGRIEAEAATLTALPPAAHPCPSTFDGLDVTITVHPASGPVTVSNCGPDPRELSSSALARYLQVFVGEVLPLPSRPPTTAPAADGSTAR